MRKIFLIAGALVGIIAVPFAVQAASAVEAQRADGWRAVATERDRLRIRDWRRTWVAGLGAAKRKHAHKVAKEGPLLEPDAALLNPVPPVGTYRCRTIKLGSAGSGMLDWVDYPQFTCRIAQRGGQLTFIRLNGSQRPIGRLFPDGVRRMIFLGTLQLGDERQLLAYGTDRDRDLAGILERVGDNRWRLVFPQPAFESIIDVIELVPAA